MPKFSPDELTPVRLNQIARVRSPDVRSLLQLLFHAAQGTQIIWAMTSANLATGHYIQGRQTRLNSISGSPQCAWRHSCSTLAGNQCLPFEAIDRSIAQIDRAAASGAIDFSIASAASCHPWPACGLMRDVSFKTLKTEHNLAVFSFRTCILLAF